MNEWDSLVNAKHIDFVIESVKKYPDEWAEAWNAAWNAARGAAYGAAYGATTDAARVAAYSAALNEAWGAAIVAAIDAAIVAAYAAARDSTLALVAYDDCEQYLGTSYNELLFLAKLTEIPATILLLRYAKAMELIREKV